MGPCASTWSNQVHHDEIHDLQLLSFPNPLVSNCSDFIMERIVFYVFFPSGPPDWHPAFGNLLTQNWTLQPWCKVANRIPNTRNQMVDQNLRRMMNMMKFSSRLGIFVVRNVKTKARENKEMQGRKDAAVVSICQLSQLGEGPAASIYSILLENVGTTWNKVLQLARSFIIFSDGSQWISASWGFQSEWEMLQTLDAARCIRAKAKAHRASHSQKSHHFYTTFTPHGHFIRNFCQSTEFAPPNRLCAHVPGQATKRGLSRTHFSALI